MRAFFFESGRQNCDRAIKKVAVTSGLERKTLDFPRVFAGMPVALSGVAGGLNIYGREP
jgi:hypothetical protein